MVAGGDGEGRQPRRPVARRIGPAHHLHRRVLAHARARRPSPAGHLHRGRPAHEREGLRDLEGLVRPYLKF
jgi:hypothetical protein